jgi:hypothetical protein
MILYQNDFTDLPDVPKNGCLFMSLIRVVSEELVYVFSKAEVARIYSESNAAGFLGTEEAKSEQGAFVWNHEGVLNKASEVAGSSDRWQYLARIYMPQETSKGHADYISDVDYWKDAEAMIFQIQTQIGGHFLKLGYDPWKFGTEERYLKSVRYYRRA